MSGAKKSRGRQKIEIKKITNDSHLQVTFSKRRSGIFKKASELCTLCGADVALVVFSPSGKPFSFGQPSVDAVIQRYLDGAAPPRSGAVNLFEAHRGANVRELNAQLTQINNHLDSERKRSEGLNLMRRDAQTRMWWAKPIDTMSKAQLVQFKEALEELKKHVARFIDKAMIQSIANHPVLPASSDRAMLQSIENYQTPSAPDRATLQLPGTGIANHQFLPAPSSSFPPDMAMLQSIANHNFFPAGASSSSTTDRALLQTIANNQFFPNAAPSSSTDHRAMLQSIESNKFFPVGTSTSSSNANLPVFQPQPQPPPQMFQQQMIQPPMLQNMMRHPGFDNIGMEGGCGIPDGFFDL
ncbi:hypothetical protein VNO78_19275 [Psophocarpus tetragonolobus]|uniref:MADS-box domain-containing protein n=1 Tax=Psophocarpus tetragonolobus TaxID=3891 RepID=A0AAN9S819_PSOTE